MVISVLPLVSHNRYVLNSTNAQSLLLDIASVIKP